MLDVVPMITNFVILLKKAKTPMSIYLFRINRPVKLQGLLILQWIFLYTLTWRFLRLRVPGTATWTISSIHKIPKSRSDSRCNQTHVVLFTHLDGIKAKINRGFIFFIPSRCVNKPSSTQNRLNQVILPIYSTNQILFYLLIYSLKVKTN